MWLHKIKKTAPIPVNVLEFSEVIDFVCLKHNLYNSTGEIIFSDLIRFEEEDLNARAKKIIHSPEELIDEIFSDKYFYSFNIYHYIGEFDTFSKSTNLTWQDLFITNLMLYVYIEFFEYMTPKGTLEFYYNPESETSWI